MVAGLGLLLVSGAAWSAKAPPTSQQDTTLNFICVSNGTCVYTCGSDRDCIKAGCLLPHCDPHTPDGSLCLSDQLSTLQGIGTYIATGNPKAAASFLTVPGR
jgi:hypothetical protein